MLLTSVGEHFGTALERASLSDSLRDQRIKEQAALLALSNQLLMHTSLTNLTSFLVKEITRLLGVDACALVLPNEEKMTNWSFKPL